MRLKFKWAIAFAASAAAIMPTAAQQSSLGPFLTFGKKCDNLRLQSFATTRKFEESFVKTGQPSSAGNGTFLEVNRPCSGYVKAYSASGVLFEGNRVGTLSKGRIDREWPYHNSHFTLPDNLADIPKHLSRSQATGFVMNFEGLRYFLVAQREGKGSELFVVSMKGEVQMSKKRIISLKYPVRTIYSLAAPDSWGSKAFVLVDLPKAKGLITFDYQER